MAIAQCASEEIAGQTRQLSWQYDADGKLIQESATSAGATSATSYQYDSAGNRTQKSQTTGSAAPVVTLYSYNSLDQLTAESTSGGTVICRCTHGTLPRLSAGRDGAVYQWDANRNMIMLGPKSGPRQESRFNC
ncbi:RHS repeat domain-containing protein [Ottowia testudinis]|uniref:RHS repeat protein n=1 Tax=Ottowia testudinis TaxID=2816950 RepID=A0A975CGB6_9BURK|nr:RHS repeat domain-containing protein [Ottowia testudinis]QTD45267.1 RHS repeat protein [Ottowia testudinis]